MTFFDSIDLNGHARGKRPRTWFNVDFWVTVLIQASDPSISTKAWFLLTIFVPSMSCHQTNLNLEKYWRDQESNPELTENYDSEAYHYHFCQWLAYTMKKYSLQKKQVKCKKLRSESNDTRVFSSSYQWRRRRRKTFAKTFFWLFLPLLGKVNFVFCRPPIYFSKSGIDRQLKEWLGDFFCQSCPTEYIED